MIGSFDTKSSKIGSSDPKRFQNTNIITFSASSEHGRKINSCIDLVKLIAFIYMVQCHFTST